jgi:hypothetical protein
MTIKNDNNSLFYFLNDKVTISPKILFIPEFSDLYERDRSQGKKKAMKEFAYIYYMADYKSEYNSYGLNKETQLGVDIFQNRNYRSDLYVKKAIEKYQKLQETPSMQYLIAIRNRVEKIIRFLDGAETKDKDNEDKYKNPFITIEKVTKAFNDLENVLEKLEKWEKKVFDEEEEMQIRGGGVLNAFENPEDAKWMIKK